MADSVIQLKCYCNYYPWGKTGGDSLAAQLCAKTNSDFKIENDKDYAEMWMGTYPSLPSYSLATGEDLQQILNKNSKQLIGETVLSKFGTNLPFLPKILSIKKALPLQIHPDMELATQLHKKNPDKFTDTNHKPEIAIALSKFELFVGFKPKADIEALFSAPCLQPFLPSSPSNTTFDDATIRHISKSILLAPPTTISSIQSSLAHLNTGAIPENQRYILDLLPRLQSQYEKQDPGTLVALLLMNFLTLSPGQAIYVPANGLHAYLSGDIVECMARSNNMLSTGFCPVADRDSAQLFTDALTFEQHDPKAPLIKSQRFERSKNGKTRVFRPELSEFEMLVTEVGKGAEETVEEVEGPSVLFATEGKGKIHVDDKEWDISEGSIYFIGQGQEVKLTEVSESLVVYRAYAD